jgi:hypothetical protein
VKSKAHLNAEIAARLSRNPVFIKKRGNSLTQRRKGPARQSRNQTEAENREWTQMGANGF